MTHSTTPLLPQKDTQELIALLKKVLTNWAEEERMMGKNVWNILSKDAIRCIASRVPTTIQELKKTTIVGTGAGGSQALVLGENVVQQYGEHIVQIVQKFVQKNGLETCVLNERQRGLKQRTKDTDGLDQQQQQQQQGIMEGGVGGSGAGSSAGAVFNEALTCRELLLTVVAQQKQNMQQTANLQNSLHQLATTMARIEANMAAEKQQRVRVDHIVRGRSNNSHAPGNNQERHDVGKGSQQGGDGSVHGGRRGRDHAANSRTGGGGGGATVVAAAASQAGGLVGVAELVSYPKDLFTLWDEYQHGIGGRKAARLFTPQERAQPHIKHKYQRRKFVWDIISHLMAADRRVHHAIDYREACQRIYAAYPGLSLTKIISRIQLDKRNNTMPASLTGGS
jgi:hypothetical protein